VVSEVRPQVSGIIRERLFTEGADVQAGQVLYQIDDALYQAAHNRARAALMEAEANLNAARLLSDRSARLVQTKAISRQDYDNAVSSRGQSEARVAAARAELETAAINLEYTKVTSPVHGRIGSSAVTPGALVTQNQAAPLAIVQQLDPIYVDITQSSSELLRLREAMDKGTLSRSDAFARVGLILENGKPYVSLKPVSEAEQSPDADVSSLYVSRFEEEPVHGSLEFSDVTVDQSTGVIRMRALFPNPDLILLPGMYVRLVLEEGVRNAAILLPQRAVQRDNRGQAVVWVLTPVPTPALAQEGAQGEDLFLAEQRILLLDRALDNQWLVSGGLKAGELVLVEGISKIRAGRPVKAEEYRPQAPADVAQAPSGGN
jgi:RND family efflux transporter, MFP subunit